MRYRVYIESILGQKTHCVTLMFHDQVVQCSFINMRSARVTQGRMMSKHLECFRTIYDSGIHELPQKFLRSF